jgi:NAD(P)-dependent dehydrogenase (short-subunit alcohol dehydrogenase family)
MVSKSWPKTYLILGASRGIGLELVAQLLSQNQIVIATQRTPANPSPLLKKLSDTHAHKENRGLTVLNCDFSDEDSISKFAVEVGELVEDGGLWDGAREEPDGKRAIIDTVIFNAGILEYPARVSDLYVLHCLFQ